MITAELIHVKKTIKNNILSLQFRVTFTPQTKNILSPEYRVTFTPQTKNILSPEYRVTFTPQTKNILSPEYRVASKLPLQTQYSLQNIEETLQSTIKQYIVSRTLSKPPQTPQNTILPPEYRVTFTPPKQRTYCLQNIE